MKQYSSRWKDLRAYKNKYIFLQVLGERGIRAVRTPKGSFYQISCPFHTERTPSCNIFHNTDEWRFKCLGCGKSGDVFMFVQMYEQWEFWEAMAYVTKRFAAYASMIDRYDANQVRIPFPYFTKPWQKELCTYEQTKPHQE